MNHAVNAFFHFHECAVGGEVTHLAGDTRTDRVTILHGVPRIGFGLADAECDLLVLRIDAQHHHVHFVANAEHVSSAVHALRPAEFRNVDEAFDAGFEFNECAIRSNVDDLTAEAGFHRITVFDVVPRIVLSLLEAEGDAFAFQVDFEDHHIEFLTVLEEFGRVLDAAPAHIGDVEQAIHAIEVHECTEVGDVLDLTVDDLTLLEGFEESVLLLSHLAFEEFTTRDDDVAAFVGNLDDGEIQCRIGDVDVQVAGGVDVDLRAGEECIHAVDSHDQAATNLALDDARNRVAFFVLGEDSFPADLFIGLALGDHDHAVFTFEVDQEDIEFITDVHCVDVFELIGGDRAGRLAADIDEHFVAALSGDLTLHDRASSGNAVLLSEGSNQFIIETTGLCDRLLRFANSHLALLSV